MEKEIRLEIDGLIATVITIDELLYELELKGYTMKRRKIVIIKPRKNQKLEA